jgi:hypothetical protein
VYAGMKEVELLEERRRRRREEDGGVFRSLR